MSESPAGPRRSQRDKKQAKPIALVTPPTTGKRKRNHAEIETEDNGLTSGLDDADHNADDAASVAGGEDGRDGVEEEDGEEYHAPKPKATGSARKTKAKNPATKPKGPPPAKKQKVTKAAVPKAPKAATRKGRKPKEGDDATFDLDQVAKDTKINADNPLFNAIMNPSAALQGTAEDFLESLEQNAGTAQAELINLILRSCGCNDSVNADEALDYDGVVEALDNFTEGLKKDDSPTYPLTSKLLPFKKFRAHLSEFISRLITSSADLGSLYTTDLITTLQQWVIAMSSSQIRSFRHTATVVALEVEAALCDVARGVEKEVEVVGRQREGEKKRRVKGAATNGRDKASTAREKELESKMKEVKNRMSKLEEFIKEFIDGVFVHRFRDLDPLIRAECIHSLGLYFKKHPSHFLSTSYLRYVGWVLSDSATPVRLAAIKALQTVYSLSSASSGEADHLLPSLNHFTERFKPRLLEMAEGDTDVSIRVGVLGVLGEIDKAGLLEEDERERLGGLVFCEDAKVRKGVSGFVRGVWEEWTEERVMEMGGAINGSGAKGKKAKGKGKTELDSSRIGIKGLAVLLIKWGKILDEIIGDDSDIEDQEDDADELGQGTSKGASKRSKQMAALAANTSHRANSEGRTALAVDALWEELEPVRDWEGILDMLLLDHSAAGEDQATSSRVRRGGGRLNGKKHAAANDAEDDGDEDAESVQVDEAWRLEEVEEGLLLEVLVASLTRAEKEASNGKKGEDENVTNDITRILIKGLPRLFIKHQTDETRIADVLILPKLMNLDLYLEMRMLKGYATLWDDVIKQFGTHTSPTVLSLACSTIGYFMNTTSLSNANSTKILELEDELSSNLRDTVAGREEIEVASFTEDEVISLAALSMRLRVLAGMRDMTGWIEEDEGGKQSSAWDILSAIVERGRLGYKEEEVMIEQTLHLLTLHIIWKAKGLTAEAAPSTDDTRYQDALKAQREALMEKLIEYAIGTQSNTLDGVKRAAFKNLLDLHVLFSSKQTVAADGSPLPTASVALEMDDEVQYRCAGYIQAEIERYADTLADEAGDDDDGGDDEDEDDEGPDGDNTPGSKKKKQKSTVTKTKKAEKEVDVTSRAHLVQEYVFIDVVSTFLRAIRAGAIDVRHGAVLLAHYGRLGPSFDICIKVVIDVLREEGMINNEGDAVVVVVTQALQEAYTLVLEAVVEDETNSLQLSKLLATCFVIRGSQLSIVRRLDSDYVVQIQLNLLTWIGKRLATYQNNGNKESMKIGVVFFRVLIPLLASIQSRDALRIKAHADQILAQAKVDASQTTKLWEPLRAYERRLATVMSKDKGRKVAKGAKTAAAAGFTDEEESEVERIVDEDPVPPPASHRRPRRSRRAPVPNPADDAELSDPAGSQDAATPKARPRPKPTYQSQKISPSKVPQESDVEETVLPDLNGFVTPQKSRKRARSEVDDDEEPVSDAPNPRTGSGDQDTEQEQEPATPPADMLIRKKRVRH